MGEGLAVLAGSRNTVRTMATRDIYESGFDEDVRTESNANQCPECDGRVTTNAVETVCEDWAWSSTNSASITGRSGGRTTTRSANERVPHSLWPATTAACRRKSVAAPTRRGTRSPGRSDGDSRGCAVSRPVVAGGRKQNGISHTGWAKCVGLRVPSSSPIRCVTNVSDLPERSERGFASWQIHRGHRRGQRVRGLPV